MDPVYVLATLGGVAARHQLLEVGVSEFDLGRARHDGHILRVRRAWYALPSADPEVIAAVRVGGMLTCGNLLRMAGVWSPAVAGVHVSVAANASRLRSVRTRFVPFAEEREGVVLHWRQAAGATTRPTDTVLGALVQLRQCVDEPSFLAAADSAVRQGRASVEELQEQGVPIRLLQLIDGSSESGGETRLRLRLRALRIAHRSQEFIPGVGRVDFLIGQRLVLEVDGFEHHGTREGFERDRLRDRLLVSRGYLVMRLTYRQLESEWPRIERALLAIIRSDRHRWRIRDRPRNSGGEGVLREHSPQHPADT